MAGAERAGIDARPRAGAVPLPHPLGALQPRQLHRRGPRERREDLERSSPSFAEGTRTGNFHARPEARDCKWCDFDSPLRHARRHADPRAQARGPAGGRDGRDQGDRVSARPSGPRRSTRRARRDRRRRSTQNLCVEAGAGTGKTTSLVERIVEVLRAGRRRRSTSIVVITFTEKAAAELSARVRERLEEARRAAESDAGARGARAPRHGGWPTSTARGSRRSTPSPRNLLRERPVEAGLDPAVRGARRPRAATSPSTTPTTTGSTSCWAASTPRSSARSTSASRLTSCGRRPRRSTATATCCRSPRSGCPRPTSRAVRGVAGGAGAGARGAARRCNDPEEDRGARQIPCARAVRRAGRGRRRRRGAARAPGRCSAAPTITEARGRAGQLGGDAEDCDRMKELARRAGRGDRRRCRPRCAPHALLGVLPARRGVRPRLRGRSAAAQAAPTSTTS